jgi:TonB family protein
MGLECVSVVSPQRYTDGNDPDYLFPKLCFDASPLLRFIVTSDTTVTYNKYQVFQARGVAFQVEVTVLGKKTSTMDITLLEPLSAGDEAQVKPDANAIPQPLAIVAGMRKPVPVYQEGAVYPSAAMHDHILGGVAVPVIIQRDGKVKVNGPASGNYLLGQSAADAISHWKFEPYLVDGQPVEIATTLVYVFDGKPFASQVGKSNAHSTSGYDHKRDPDKDLAQAIAASEA